MLFRKNNFYKGLFTIFLFFILSLVFVYPFYNTYTVFHGDDLLFHIERINEITENLKHLHIFTGIYTHSILKIGYPLNLFYPWVTVLPFSLFQIILGNNVVGIYAGICFYTFFTLLFTYKVSYKICNNYNQSVFTAVLYAFCSFRSCDIFIRFALGEFIALTFLPLCVYGIYAILLGNYHDWPYLGFGMSFVLLSHVLSTVMNTILMILLLLIMIFKIGNNKLKRVLSLGKSILLFVLSSAIFIFPFLEQVCFQAFKQPGKMVLQDQAIALTDLLSQSINNNMDSFVQYYPNIGLVLVIVILIGLINFRSFNSMYKVLYCLGAFFLFISTSLFPWYKFENSLLSIIQFPWRFLGISSFMLSLIGGYEFELLSKEIAKKRRTIILILLTSLSLIIWGTSIHQVKSSMISTAYRCDKYDNNGYHIAKNMINNRLKLYYFTDQYSPKAGLEQLTNIQNHIGLVNDKKILLKPKSNHVNQITFTSDKIKIKNSIIVFPMFNYRNIIVTNANAKQIPIKFDKYHRIKILNRDGLNSFTIKYRLSTIDKISIIISLLTWLSSLLFYLNHNIKRVKLLLRNQDIK
ncbi:hypothetical protein [Limosilactobacillus coleohominis]|uniref:hypothetical protein n=1 Tax=Limosilactobacillus coleohominis TaxID=181675 RepID=UPI0026E9D305|nr:hypothetical protein [Limosilactobacillus coleohominis]